MKLRYKELLAIIDERLNDVNIAKCIHEPGSQLILMEDVKEFVEIFLKELVESCKLKGANDDKMV